MPNKTARSAAEVYFSDLPQEQQDHITSEVEEILKDFRYAIDITFMEAEQAASERLQAAIKKYGLATMRAVMEAPPYEITRKTSYEATLDLAREFNFLLTDARDGWHCPNE